MYARPATSRYFGRRYPSRVAMNAAPFPLTNLLQLTILESGLTQRYSRIHSRKQSVGCRLKSRHEPFYISIDRAFRLSFSFHPETLHYSVSSRYSVFV